MAPALRSFQIGRRTVYLTDHARDRYYERTEVRGRLNRLERELEVARWDSCVPSWSRLSFWHRARAAGSVVLDDDRAFIVNCNPNGDLMAVTYLVREPVPAG